MKRLSLAVVIFVVERLYAGFHFSGLNAKMKRGDAGNVVKVLLNWAAIYCGPG